MSEEGEQVVDLEQLERKNRVAQWVFDTLPVLNRFHLWLHNVEGETLSGKDIEETSFLHSSMSRAFVMSAAVTALGTRLFGRYGEGKGKEKNEINLVKKDADAISAYAMSEGLWHLSRNLPENHAILICLGEGLLPKAGETPDMGANPLLGFGRIYARPQVAKFVEKRVHRLINDPDYEWDDFYTQITEHGITIWGAAVDTLENTNRFAIGAETGPITVLHLFDQPLAISKPYEGYIGSLLVPRKVRELAEDNSVLINVHTPRKIVFNTIKEAYPGIKSEHIHVWTLRGSSRKKRIGSLWNEWSECGVDLVKNGDLLRTGKPAFTSSGTYAPTFTVGSWEDEQKQPHVFIVDGYAASAEAVQGATLAAMMDIDCTMVMYSSRYLFSHELERQLVRLDPDDPDFKQNFLALVPEETDSTDELIEEYRAMIVDLREAGLNTEKRSFIVDDLFPRKRWDGVALVGYMLTDPYADEPEVKKVDDNIYEVAVRLVTPRGMKRYTITLELRDDWEESLKIFNPLLDRFVAGESYQDRPVKKSDSGRIRNELQTLCSQALEHFGDKGVRVRFSQIDDLTIPREKKEKIKEILAWFKIHHPIWFDWLKIGD